MSQTSNPPSAFCRITCLAGLLAACAGPSGSSHSGTTASPPQAAPPSAPPAAPPATSARRPAALHADQLFWRTFHAGAYDKIPSALRALKAAYLDHPHDAVTAAHIGWLHIWRLAEHARLTALDPEITDDAVLGRAYFEQAVRLEPRDARYQGFYATLLLTEASLHQDDELRRRGTSVMTHAVAAWPEFNLFTAGYGPSGAPYQSAQFHDALEAQWRNLEICFGRKADRKNPDISGLPRPSFEGARRACADTDIAPHNAEGFYLNFGDMLVKAGEVGAGVTMYRNAQSVPSYATWPFRDVVEARIRDAAANVAGFRQPHRATDRPAMMISSTFACMACHQQ